MATKSKDQTKTTKQDPHIPPIAGVIFAVCLIIATLGSIYLDGITYPTSRPAHG